MFLRGQDNLDVISPINVALEVDVVEVWVDDSEMLFDIYYKISEIHECLSTSVSKNIFAELIKIIYQIPDGILLWEKHDIL